MGSRCAGKSTGRFWSSSVTTDESEGLFLSAVLGRPDGLASVELRMWGKPTHVRVFHGLDGVGVGNMCSRTDHGVRNVIIMADAMRACGGIRTPFPRVAVRRGRGFDSSSNTTFVVTTIHSFRAH